MIGIELMGIYPHIHRAIPSRKRTMAVTKQMIRPMTLVIPTSHGIVEKLEVQSPRWGEVVVDAFELPGPNNLGMDEEFQFIMIPLDEMDLD